jgi:hypothetical protein
MARSLHALFLLIEVVFRPFVNPGLLFVIKILCLICTFLVIASIVTYIFRIVNGVWFYITKIGNVLVVSISP